MDRQAKTTIFLISFYTAEESHKFEVELQHSCKSRIKEIYNPRSFVYHITYKIHFCHLKKMSHIQTCSDERYKNNTINSNPSQYTDLGERITAFFCKI